MIMSKLTVLSSLSVMCPHAARHAMWKVLRHDGCHNPFNGIVTGTNAINATTVVNQLNWVNGVTTVNGVNGAITSSNRFTPANDMITRKPISTLAEELSAAHDNVSYNGTWRHAADGSSESGQAPKSESSLTHRERSNLHRAQRNLTGLKILSREYTRIVIDGETPSVQLRFRLSTAYGQILQHVPRNDNGTLKNHPDIEKFLKELNTLREDLGLGGETITCNVPVPDDTNRMDEVASATKYDRFVPNGTLADLPQSPYEYFTDEVITYAAEVPAVIDPTPPKRNRAANSSRYRPTSPQRAYHLKGETAVPFPEVNDQDYSEEELLRADAVRGRMQDTLRRRRSNSGRRQFSRDHARQELLSTPPADTGSFAQELARAMDPLPSFYLKQQEEASRNFGSREDEGRESTSDSEPHAVGSIGERSGQASEDPKESTNDSGTSDQSRSYYEMVQGAGVQALKWFGL